ncbi:MAG: ROK family protein [Fimbriimonadia bacterium]
MIAPYIIGIDIGGSKCAVSLARHSEIVGRWEFPTEEEPSPEAVLRRLAHLADAATDRIGVSRQDVIGVGVSCGGPLDSETGMILSPPNLPDWDAVPAKEILEQALLLPVKVENDANATALAEWRLGAGRGCRSMAFLTVGTGIGAGLILDGNLYRGKRGLAGEIGHATILPEGPPCLCGKVGCLEALASGSALGRTATALFHGRTQGSASSHEVSGREVVEAFHRGNPQAREIVLRSAAYLGIGIANLLHTLDLERVILGTIAIHAGEEYLEAVRSSVAAHCWPSIWEGVEILPCGLGDRAQDYAGISLWLE